MDVNRRLDRNNITYSNRENEPGIFGPGMYNVYAFAAVNTIHWTLLLGTPIILF
ncbi:unnamed protein product, partial [marine sediment metagenome]